MRWAPEKENQFVVELLATLQRDRFRLPGWRRFLGRSWDMSRKTARDNPSLQRSWGQVTLLIGILALTILVINFSFEGPVSTVHLLPAFLFCVAWQQSDLFWHLGLNKQAQSGRMLPTVGTANMLTWVRGLCASYLLARISGGLETSSWLALIVFLVGVATDIFDGQVARLTSTQSRLGQIGDAEADFCLYLALTIILMQNSVLPLWLGLVMLLRFFVPLIAALASYFLFAFPVRFGSTVWGKYAGLAQCLYFLVLLVPPQFAPMVQPVNLPLLAVTLLLLIVAPLAQIVENVRPHHSTPGTR
jgi:phosphatidylglycerophosphate synthase